MNGFRLTVASPNGNIFDEEVVMLSVRGTEGELAVMAGHVPFVTAIVECDCKIELNDAEESERVAHINGGILTVSKNSVTLLTGSFEWK